MRGRHRLVVLALAALLAVAGADQALAGTSGQSAVEAVRSVEAKKKKKLVKKLPHRGVRDRPREPEEQGPLLLGRPRSETVERSSASVGARRRGRRSQVPKGVAVPKRLKGFKGKFGVIRRPDGRRQLTYKRLPLYTYAHEGPGQVLCNNVDGWFVVRV